MLLGSAFIISLILAGCGTAIESPEPVVFSAVSSDSTITVARQLAATFTEQTPRVSFEIGVTNSSRALARLGVGEIDFALTTLYRPELDQFRQIPIARDGLAIIVHPDNPVDNLTLRDLEHLYSGKIFDWRDIPGAQSLNDAVQVLVREQDSGTGAVFQSKVLPNGRITPNARVFPNSRAMVDYVAQTPQAIGYVSTTQLSEKVKIVAVEEILPTPATLANAAYPLTYLVYLVIPLESDPVVQDFANFALGPAGQSVMVTNGLGRIN